MRSSRRWLIHLAFLTWALAWVVLALQVAIEVRGLRDLSTTVQRTGVAVRESGEALERLGRLPVVGEDVRGPAERIQRAGQSAIESGESSRDSIRDLSILLAIAIAVLPSVAVLGIVLQLRHPRPGSHGTPQRRHRRLTAE